ncbi:MAG TPA: C4-type zinc ribbon domain-containing protein [Dehalococcoidia bacterium]|nr:C4-type zinc ribbon domain-containing protein [Dehalococcoidia bacterium]
MTSAADLFALQEIDLRRDIRRAVIADIESRLEETETVHNARQAVADSEDDLQGLQRLQRSFDAKLADLDAKIQPLEKKMYDGSVRNPKELTDMQKELDHFKTQRGKLDDEGLELIEAIEQTTRLLSEQKETLEQAETSWQQEKTQLLDQKAVAESDYASLEEQRDNHTAEMDRGMLGLYESLRTSKSGRAVALAVRGQCQGCRITLPTHLVQRLRGGGLLIQCPNCERILVAG